MKCIQDLTVTLKSRNLLPKYIEFSNWNDWTIVSVYNTNSSKYISESVSMGVDLDPQIAFAKAIVEYNERSLSKQSPTLAAKATSRSDGFAAFPVYNNNQIISKIICRKNAFLEAVERYLWAKWWDDSKTSFEVNIWNPLIFDTSTIKKIQNSFLLKSIHKITVTPANSPVVLIILMAENNHGGFVTGGAAAFSDEINDAETRSFGELLRHLIALEKIKTEFNPKSFSFYEQRLWGFGSGLWRDLVIERMSLYNEQKITLPKLSFDDEIAHSHSDIISIHRCLFSDQPLFIGGTLERLCI